MCWEGILPSTSASIWRRPPATEHKDGVYLVDYSLGLLWEAWSAGSHLNHEMLFIQNVHQKSLFGHGEECTAARSALFAHKVRHCYL